ncbi:hypothetical protein JZU61_07810 [bacterium]|jgi:hypothetical protein|nr:hypothetical protein [bacterium]
MKKATKKERLVRIAVVMESNPKQRDFMVKMASHDDAFDYVLQANEPEKFYKYVASLKKRGIRINRLLLMGHGSTAYFYEQWYSFMVKGKKIDEKLRHKVGDFNYNDFDWKGIQKNYVKSQEALNDLNDQLRKISKKIGEVKTEKIKERLKEEKEALLDQIKSKKELVKVNGERMDLMDDVSDSMAPGAKVGLFNCYGAENSSFFDNIGELFLHKHGGEIKGTTGLLVTNTTHPLVEWITKDYSTGIHTTGKWKTKTILPATHCNGRNHKPTCTCGWGGPR